jgi:tRNA dimethylallyltransferase
MISSYNIITILGPTATGKTQLAALLCNKINGEIISADSRQVYRDMNLGTGKDYEDYTIGSKTIPFHLIDIKDSGYKYNVFEFQQDFLKSLDIVKNNRHFPVLCGGTGLYIDAALKGYLLIEVPPNNSLRTSLADKSLTELTTILKTYKLLHNTTDVDTVKRAIRAIEIEDYYKNRNKEINPYPKLNSLVIGIDCERNLRRQRITDRLKKRIDEGLIEEVEALLNKGLSPDDLIYYGLEYKYITEYLTGKYNFDNFLKNLETAIHQFAKRQMTYFRGMERKGTIIHWIDSTIPNDEKTDIILQLLNQ